MRNYYVSDIVKATRGELLCGNMDVEISTVSTDSNKIGENCLFVPVIGERVDAHKFIDSAIENGAAAVLTSEHDEMNRAVPFIRVNNTVMALQEMGKEYGKRMLIPKIGVTGSVGKTTTKEMIACALSSGYKVFKTSGNSNSQRGGPITLLQMDGTEQIAVIEMGMSMKGEMARLAKLLDLDDAVITNIGVSHIEQLKTQEGICEEKLHIEDAVKAEDGVVFINGDDAILQKFRDRISHKVISFGFADYNDYFATNVRVKNNGIDFDLNIRNKGLYKMRLNVLGEHNVRNALVAVAVAVRHGVEIQDAITALAEYEGVTMRQQISRVEGVTIIDDSYNASPDSMKAGIDVLCSVDITGRRVAVLADMLELGEDAAKYHEEVGEYVAGKNIDELILLGELSEHIGKGAANGKLVIRNMDSRESVNEYLKETLKAEDAVLFKGSRGMKLNECADYLKGKR